MIWATFNSAGNTNFIKDSCKILLCLETVLICLNSPKCLKYQSLADSQYTKAITHISLNPPKYIQYNIINRATFIPAGNINVIRVLLLL